MTVAPSIAVPLSASMTRPEVMVLGRPVFDASAPLLRVRGRRISNGWTRLETWGAGVADSLYGFRVYPIGPLLRVMRGQRWMRRFYFDTEAAVRLAGAGVKPVNIDRVEALDLLSRGLEPAAVELALRQTQRAQSLIHGTNVNVRLLLEVLFLDYPLA